MHPLHAPLHCPLPLAQAFDCYVALFYIAFELSDVERLRLELIYPIRCNNARIRNLSNRIVLKSFDPVQHECHAFSKQPLLKAQLQRLHQVRNASRRIHDL